MAVFLGEAVFTLTAIEGVRQHDFTVFFGSYMLIFLLAGAGNGSTYRMIPSIFAALGRDEARDKGLDLKATALEFKRRAAAVIGIAGAVGAFGGFLIQLAFRAGGPAGLGGGEGGVTPAEKLAVAQANADWSIPALYVFLGAYVILAALTWFCYLRRSFATSRVPSLAHASI